MGVTIENKNTNEPYLTMFGRAGRFGPPAIDALHHLQDYLASKENGNKETIITAIKNSTTSDSPIGGPIPPLPPSLPLPTPTLSESTNLSSNL